MSGTWHFEGLPLGAVSASVALFQGQIESVLGEDLLAAGVKVYLDDILVFSNNKEEHVALLEKICAELREVGLKVRLDNCQFMKD
jgi:hypothetical protein